MTKIKIKKLNENAIIPQYQTKGASGLDLCSCEDLTIPKGKWTLIPTGLAISIEEGFEVQVRPRSGLALKHGISVLNTPGTIDSDYRGEIKIIAINFGESDFSIKKGERIAQAVLCKVEKAVLEEVDTLDTTLRGEGGFGSTNK
ncbi:dUTP diphosphatase [Helicobacter burdigaliensis]|uniref:dUTP diphosphatase n=1 Tax=Helicobacter burdigaliensis TaxID=2315334 RepID=UPI000EF65246|nr:dUTP diphosphatase [Helicobacter burdigaliensis]